MKPQPTKVTLYYQRGWNFNSFGDCLQTWVSPEKLDLRLLGSYPYVVGESESRTVLVPIELAKEVRDYTILPFWIKEEERHLIEEHLSGYWYPREALEMFVLQEADGLGWTFDSCGPGTSFQQNTFTSEEAKALFDLGWHPSRQKLLSAALEAYDSL